MQSPLGICCTLTRPAAPPIFLSLSLLPFKKEKGMENAWRRHGHRPVKGARDAAWSPSGWFCGWEGAQSTPHFFLSFLYIQTYILTLQDSASHPQVPLYALRNEEQFQDKTPFIFKEKKKTLQPHPLLIVSFLDFPLHPSSQSQPFEFPLFT